MLDKEIFVMYELSDYGVYAITQEGPLALAAFNDSYPSFKHFKTLPSLIREGQKLELVIFIPDFKAESLQVSFRKLAVVGTNEEKLFKVSPTDQKDVYLLTSPANYEDGQFVFVFLGWNEIAAGYVGDAEADLVAFFSDFNKEPAYAVYSDLQDVCASFPANEKLQSLMKQWEEKEALEKSSRDFNYVEEAWQAYQAEEKVAVKLRYLEKTLMEINGFLSSHPDSPQAQRCLEMQGELEAKLPQLEAMV
jgi:hypothetical protein